MNDPARPVRTDDELVRAAQSDPGSAAARAAASELFARYQQRVYLWCYRYAKERERALDLAQDVFARAWRALPGYAFRSKFSWWLFVITRNCCLNAVTAPSLLRDDEATLEGMPTSAPGPSEEYERREDEEGTRRLMLEHLDEQERTALWLCCFERMPVEGITRTLGLTNATGARGLIQRARRKLRAALEARAHEGGASA
jgi:RNA polymerase sigma-70 factor (ECF subfamily)